MQEDISNENCILGLEWNKFDDKIIFDISKICTSSFDNKKFNTIETKYIRSIRISKIQLKLKDFFQMLAVGNLPGIF